LLGSYLAYSSTLKMEIICSSEMSVDVIRITRCYVPEDRTLHSHRWDNLKSNIFTILLITNRMETNYSWEAMSRSARPRGTFPNRPVFRVKGITIPQLEDHPMSVVSGCLFNKPIELSTDRPVQKLILILCAQTWGQNHIKAL
jgi:hypothetical protein